MTLGRRAPQAQGAHQRRRAEAGARGHRLRRRGHRPVPHRAHVLRPHRRLPRDDPGRHARRPRKGPGQAAAAPAEGFRRHLPGHAGPAGDDPPARSAAARVPAAHRGRTGTSWPRRSASRPRRSPAACRSCTSSTPCSATAAAAWASSIPKSRGCRPGPSSRRPATCKKAGIDVLPEVMIPLVGFATEFRNQEKIVRETAEKVFAEKGVKVEYLVGTMIELPRAAVCADQIAKQRRVLQLRHQRPDANHAGHEPRRLRRLHQRLPREGHHPQRSVPDDRPRRRRRADEDRRGRRPQARGPTSSWASAASTAAIRPA